MTMREIMIGWLAAAGAGALLGAVFFGGLWWTVRKAVASKRPGPWFLASWLVRSAIVVAGVYGVSDRRPDRLLACLAGFVVVRFVVTRWAGPPVAAPSVNPVREAGHAS